MECVLRASQRRVQRDDARTQSLYSESCMVSSCEVIVHPAVMKAVDVIWYRLDPRRCLSSRSFDRSGAVEVVCHGDDDSHTSSFYARAFREPLSILQTTACRRHATWIQHTAIRGNVQICPPTPVLYLHPVRLAHWPVFATCVDITREHHCRGLRLDCKYAPRPRLGRCRKALYV